LEQGSTFAINNAGNKSLIINGTLDINGVNGNVVNVNNVGAGCVVLRSSAGTCLVDIEYCDWMGFLNFTSTNAANDLRFYEVDFYGAAGQVWTPISHGIMEVDHCYINGLNYVVAGGTNTARCTWLMSNMVFGKRRDGTPAANATCDIFISRYGQRVYLRNAMLTSGTPYTIGDAGKLDKYSGIYVDNYGYVEGYAGSGDAGIGLTATAHGKIERSAAAAKTGAYGSRFAPSAICNKTHELDTEIFVPIKTGDNISISVYARRTGMTNDCAKVVLDPEEAWFTSDTSAEVLTNINTWYELTASAAGAGGVGAEGMVRIVLRVDEVDGANTVDFADMVVTVT